MVSNSMSSNNFHQTMRESIIFGPSTQCSANNCEDVIYGRSVPERECGHVPKEELARPLEAEVHGEGCRKVVELWGRKIMNNMEYNLRYLDAWNALGASFRYLRTKGRGG